MSDTDDFKLWLEERGNMVTLGEILSSRHSAEYRKHFSLLRKQHINFEVTLNRKEPSKNLYQLKGERESVLRRTNDETNDSASVSVVSVPLKFIGDQATWI